VNINYLIAMRVLRRCVIALLIILVTRIFG